jgi:hypothetical protein
MVGGDGIETRPFAYPLSTTPPKQYDRSAALVRGHVKTGTNPVRDGRFTSMTERKPNDPKQTPPSDIPPPGPHARPELLDPEKTPGTGMMPDPDDPNPSPTG